MKPSLLALTFMITVVGCGPAKHGPDGGGGGGGDDSGVDGPSCAADTAQAMAVNRPVDIIWVIDNSGSMGAEETRVQNNINHFASAIAASGVDYHVIVLTDTSHISVPPPLGGSPQLLTVNVNVDSNNEMRLLIDNYAMYQAFLRPDSVKHIVVVTDDESDMNQQMVEAGLDGLTNPGFGTDWHFDAIVAEGAPWDPSTHCFLLSAAIGATYIALQTAHNGFFYSLCTTDWTPLFGQLAAAVVTGLALPCTFDIPDPPNGQTLDPNQVNFVYTPTSGSPVTFPDVGDATHCTGNGWYYDNPAAPTKIIVCPASCTTLTNDGTGSVSVEFGCSTIFE